MSFNMDNREFENRLNKEGYNLIAGCDEVGRGCIAGPVYACAIIMPKDRQIDGECVKAEVCGSVCFGHIDIRKI